MSSSRKVRYEYHPNHQRNQEGQPVQLGQQTHLYEYASAEAVTAERTTAHGRPPSNPSPLLLVQLPDGSHTLMEPDMTDAPRDTLPVGWPHYISENKKTLSDDDDEQPP